MVHIEKGTPAAFRVHSASHRPTHSSNRTSFDTVTHTTHVASAIDIIRRGHLSAGLVYDDSRLNTERIPVVWTSPNRWGPGYRYGTMQFAFSWRAIASTRRAYWVEVAHYRIKAPRILLTDVDRDDHPLLTPYDATAHRGPWHYDGTHDYYNGDVCVEFMVEGNLDLQHHSHLTFVRHHPQYCCVYPNSQDKCRERGMYGTKAAARFLARAVVESLDMSHVHFDDEALRFGCSELLDRVTVPTWAYGGAVRDGDVGADAYARALFGAFAYYNDTDRQHIAALFKSSTDVRMVCRRVLAAALERSVDSIQAE
jgi:hypothetical protein